METALSDLSTVFTRDNFGEVAGMPLATLYLNRHQFKEAAAISEKLLRARPEDPTLRNLHGIAQVGVGNLAQARGLFEKALHNKPDFDPASINLGKRDRLEGKFAEAEKRFNALRGKKPTDAQRMVENRARVRRQRR